MRPVLYLAALAACSATSPAPGPDSSTAGPTALPVDCRGMADVPVSQVDPNCDVVSDTPPGNIGTGPLFGDTFREGFLDGNSVVFASGFGAGSAWAVFSIDYQTKVRRVVSGSYRDPQLGMQTIGGGPDITDVYDVVHGPDGYYLFAGDANHPTSTWGSSLVQDPVILRVDPVTGDRTEVLDFAPASAACVTRSGMRLYPTDVLVLSGDFADYLTFDVGSDGAIYVGVGGNDAADRTWFGVARFRGGHCELVSVHDSTGADSVGMGFQLTAELGAIRVAGGTLHATPSSFDAVIDIDLATGNRRVLSTANTSNGVVGTGPAVHSGYMAIAPDGAIWTAGGVVVDTQLTAVDPATGGRTGYSGRGGWRPVYGVHASRPFVFYANGDRVDVLEYTTGNHNIIAH